MKDKIEIGDCVINPKNEKGIAVIVINNVFGTNCKFVYVKYNCGKVEIFSEECLRKIPDKPKHEFKKGDKVFIEFVVSAVCEYDGVNKIMVSGLHNGVEQVFLVNPSKVLKSDQVIVLDDSEIKEGDKVAVITHVIEPKDHDNDVLVKINSLPEYVNSSNVFKIKM